MREAIIEKYRPLEIMTDSEIKAMSKTEEEILYVNTNMRGMKKIEVLGQDQATQWRSDVRSLYEIALESLKISDIGPKGTLASMIPNTMQLYLDKNLLHSWD